jgi:hypothetical protein
MCGDAVKAVSKAFVEGGTRHLALWSVAVVARQRRKFERTDLQYELLGIRAVAQEGQASEPVRMVCPFTLKRTGQQVRIVISAGDVNQSKPVPSLMKAVARSKDWVEQIILPGKWGSTIRTSRRPKCTDEPSFEDAFNGSS